MKRLIIATNNQHKLNEFRQIFASLPNYELVSLNDLDLKVEFEETGSTFSENAFIKAKKIYDLTGEITIADDSGLEIEALNNFPGIYSARFMEGKSYTLKNKEILKMMKGKQNRNARFVCALSVIGLEANPLSFIGTFNGEINDKIDGENGFGYDPIFYYPPLNMTAGSMDDQTKNRYSHRGRALAALKDYLVKMEGEKND